MTVIFINVPKLKARIVTLSLTNLKGNATKFYTGVSKLLHLWKKLHTSFCVPRWSCVISCVVSWVTVLAPLSANYQHRPFNMSETWNTLCSQGDMTIFKHKNHYKVSQVHNWQGLLWLRFFQIARRLSGRDISRTEERVALPVIHISVLNDGTRTLEGFF